MRKAILSAFICLLFSSLVYGQAYEGSIEYDKKKQFAFVVDYPYPPEAAENAVIKKMEQLGYRGKEEKGIFNKDKGFRVYKSASIPDVSETIYDYVFKVEPRSRRDKDQSVVYMVILKDGVNIKEAFESADVLRAKGFLNNLKPVMEEEYLEWQIRNQEEVVAKAEKKLRDLKDDQASMEKKIKKLQEDLESNSKNQESQQKEIEAQQQALDALKSKRKV